MTGESTNSQKSMLAAAIAQAEPVARWAGASGVPESTAYRWAAEPGVRSEIESIRRRALDEAIDRLAARAAWAAAGIVDLGDCAASESVRLRALRPVMSDFIAVAKFLGARSTRGRNRGAVECARRRCELERLKSCVCTST
jgi:hypothetical protein